MPCSVSPKRLQMPGFLSIGLVCIVRTPSSCCHYSEMFPLENTDGRGWGGGEREGGGEGERERGRPTDRQRHTDGLRDRKHAIYRSGRIKRPPQLQKSNTLRDQPITDVLSSISNQWRSFKQSTFKADNNQSDPSYYSPWRQSQPRKLLTFKSNKMTP